MRDCSSTDRDAVRAGAIIGAVIAAGIALNAAMMLAHVSGFYVGW